MRGFAKVLWVLGWVLLAGFVVNAMGGGVGPYEVMTAVISAVLLIPFLSIKAREKQQADVR